MHGNRDAKGAFAQLQVKYDTFVTVYMSDCDFYPRVRAAGFETLNYPQVQSPLHELLQQPMLVDKKHCSAAHAMHATLYEPT